MAQRLCSACCRGPEIFGIFLEATALALGVVETVRLRAVRKRLHHVMMAGGAEAQVNSQPCVPQTSTQFYQIKLFPIQNAS